MNMSKELEALQKLHTNSFGTDFTPNYLLEEEAIEVLRQAYQTIAKKKRRNRNEQNTKK